MTVNCQIFKNQLVWQNGKKKSNLHQHFVLMVKTTSPSHISGLVNKLHKKVKNKRKTRRNFEATRMYKFNFLSHGFDNVIFCSFRNKRKKVKTVSGDSPPRWNHSVGFFDQSLTTTKKTNKHPRHYTFTPTMTQPNTEFKEDWKRQCFKG